MAKAQQDDTEVQACRRRTPNLQPVDVPFGPQVRLDGISVCSSYRVLTSIPSGTILTTGEYRIL